MTFTRLRLFVGGASDEGELHDEAPTRAPACPTHTSPPPEPHRLAHASGAATAAPAADLDMNLVARIVQQAGVRCVLETPDGSPATILAEPRHQGGRTHWTVRATRIDSHDRERPNHFCVGPNSDRSTAVPVVEHDERHLAALIVAQALRVDPAETLTFDEIEALGLGQRSCGR